MAIRHRTGRNAPWIVYWKNPFTGKTQELPCLSEADAKRENSLIKHRLKYDREWFRPEEEQGGVDGETLEACYYLYLREKKFSKKSLAWSMDSMKQILEMLGSKEITDINRQDVASMLTMLSETDVKPVTVRGKMSVFRTVMRWCADKGYIEQPPIFPKLPAAKYEKFIPPTPAELAAICEVSEPHIIRTIYIGAQMGVRVGPSELLKMEWSHIDLERGIARVRAAKKRPDQPWREVPIRLKLLEMMKEWRKEDQAVGAIYVIHYRGKPIQSIQTAWAKALARAGITRRIRPYDLRHAFATEAIAGGIDIGTVAQIMGDDPKMLLDHYQHIADKQKRAAVEALPEIEFTAKNYGTQICPESRW